MIIYNSRERKFILGNAKGEVAVYNFRNGAKMKDLDTQAGPIAGLVYCAREKAVLVACQVRTENRPISSFTVALRRYSNATTNTHSHDDVGAVSRAVVQLSRCRVWTGSCEQD